MVPTRAAALTFDDLANRLLRHLAYLVHSGETTERRLAGKIDISQSHLHNILNGTRKLTPAVADQALYYLDWSLLDLVETNEATALISRREAALLRGRYVDFAHSAIGRGYHLPGILGDEISIPFVWLAHIDSPVAVRANTDPDMDSIIEAGDTLLIDRSLAARERIDADALYVVRYGGESLARWVRCSARGLYLISTLNCAQPVDWTLVALAFSTSRAEIVEGRIIALAQPLEGKFRRPALPSASN